MLVQDSLANRGELAESQPPAPEYGCYNRLPGLLAFLAYLNLLIAAAVILKRFDASGPVWVRAVNATIIAAVGLVQFLLLKGGSQLVLVMMEMREAIRRNERHIIELAERLDGDGPV